MLPFITATLNLRNGQYGASARGRAMPSSGLGNPLPGLASRFGCRFGRRLFPLKARSCRQRESARGALSAVPAAAQRSGTAPSDARNSLTGGTRAQLPAERFLPSALSGYRPGVRAERASLGEPTPSRRAVGEARGTRSAEGPRVPEALPGEGGKEGRRRARVPAPVR